MKIYQSSLSIRVIRALNAVNASWKPNVLLTFYGLQNPMDYIKKYRGLISSLILDSGAYSINRLPISADEKLRAGEKLFKQYKAYTKLQQHNYDLVFNFDDNFKPDSFEHNLNRLMELEAEGVHAVPVIHNLSNYEAQYYADKQYGVVAIGQCQADDRQNLNVLWPVVDKLFNAQHKIKVHLFGMSAPKVIGHVPAYSCDSKTWLDYGTRGRVLYWNHERPGLDKTDIIYMPKYQGGEDSSIGTYYHDYPYLRSFKDWISEKLHLSWDDLLGVEDDHCQQLVNALYFLELEERITASHRGDGIIFD